MKSSGVKPPNTQLPDFRPTSLLKALRRFHEPDEADSGGLLPARSRQARWSRGFLAFKRFHFSGAEGAFGQKATTRATTAANTRTKAKPPPACK
jgi:hypothetical protein